MPKHTIKIFINKAIGANLRTPEGFEFFKKKLSKDGNNFCIKNAEIKKVYDEMIRKREIISSPNFEKILITKKIRTLSGVAVIAVLTKPFPCPGKCIYCPSEKAMPKSYLSNEPAVMRAIKTSFHPYLQVQARIKALQLNGHQTDKIELIVMGGTFSYFSKKYQNWFIKECFRAANDYPRNLAKTKNKSNLTKEQKRNEKTKNRIIGLTLETRPDFIDRKEIINFRKLGCTRVELGVQTVFDEILEKNKRGHGVEEIVNATKLLKNSGFKINYHLMPGLLGSNLKKDLEIFKTVFSDSRFQPDMIKLYPCVVTKDSELHNLWKKKKYKPLTNYQTKNLIKKIKKIVPPYVRITRLIRDIPEESILAGPNISNMRQLIQKEGVVCYCIRCREVKGNYKSKEKITLDRINYDASGGKEIFLQFINKNKKPHPLFALLRLRIPDKKESTSHHVDELKNCAIIREVHTYGKMTGINKKDKKSPQHIGLGKKLIFKAEKIAKDEFGLKKIAVISGIGVRNYYRKLDYKLEGNYLTKKL